jgi:hypothetical protein
LNDVVRLEQWTSQCTIKNKDFLITVYLASDVIDHFDKNGLPENVNVIEGIPIF